MVFFYSSFYLKLVLVVEFIFLLLIIETLFNGQEWTDTPTIPSALVSMLLRLPKLRFVIVTLGENGCIMLERSTDGEFL